MSFLGMGPLELIVILLIAFVILGPEKMLDSARWMGKAVKELRRMAAELPSLTEEDFQPTPITRRPNQERASTAQPQSGAPDAAPADGETKLDEHQGEDGPVEFRSSTRTRKAESDSEPAKDREQA
ncbi:MAG: Sec-independent protein translocase subunit TatA/TatB [Ardenticatenaceae bacterium]